MGRRLVSELAGRRLLDYGCGDGTFLALIGDYFPNGVGADLDAKEVARTTERLAEIPGISFQLIEDLRTPSHDRVFDVVPCMEVLEHCVPENETRVISDLTRSSLASLEALVRGSPQNWVGIGDAEAPREWYANES